MDFSLNDEQQMLAEMVGRFIEREYDFEKRRKLADSAQGWSQDNWNALAETGLLALNVPEDFGGLNASPAENLLVMEGFGRGLLLEPYLPTAVVGASLIGKLGSAAQQAELLPELAVGNLRVALAALEPQARFDLNDVATSAKAQGDGYVLNGQKAVVLHADSAQKLIVSARTSGSQFDKAGISLFLVNTQVVGVSLRTFAALDGQRVSEVQLDNAPATLLGQLDGGYADLEWAVDRAIFALCAEAVGVMDKLTALTIEYLQTRKQFGVAIGSFQALQHKAADMLGAVEQARSITYFAAANLDSEDPVQRRKAVSSAKALIGRSGRLVSQTAIQLHGGMGMTDELSCGWYAKRLLCIDMSWGDADHHVELYSDVM
ncbi:pimeloyl-CoA dehydrogenase small subunit [Pseudomonas cavernae]|uniref:Pimeloyl-CoA dehydrogenase small subunit n=1 Tax=Pseudomonas cavernae TaxID=2320867 RepID=A0A385Z0X5_9PSED|nr:acyl-CoA dehydrogenase family protein [Pseudomonas cavernae]AYC31548.1 pimeloyl-CoA dehydrogenase small subunit [Pseudomonas cavernae]